jgi:hypothetical protein
VAERAAVAGRGAEAGAAVSGIAQARFDLAGICAAAQNGYEYPPQIDLCDICQKRPVRDILEWFAGRGRSLRSDLRSDDYAAMLTG